MNLEQELIKLRKISHNWSNTEEVIEILQNTKEFLRYNTILTKELWDLYDEVTISLMILVDEIDEIGFDGRIFTNALTRFGFNDFTRDDYLECLNS